MIKRILIISLLLISFGGAQNIQAQDNVGKLNFSSLASKRIELGYERVINDNQSAVINVGYMWPRNIPLLGIAESLYSPEDSVGLSTSAKGIKLLAEYRFYLNADRRRSAPGGFYIGPYVYGSNYRTDIDVELLDYTLSLDGNMFTIGAGAEIGVQWLINDVVTIDFSILGLGLGYSKFGGEITSQDFTEAYESTVADINEKLEELPGKRWKQKLMLDPDDLGIDVGFKTGMPNLRIMLSVGVVF